MADSGTTAPLAFQDLRMSANFQQLANFIWSVADLLRGPYRPPQYERVMLPLTHGNGQMIQIRDRGLATLDGHRRNHTGTHLGQQP